MTAAKLLAIQEFGHALEAEIHAALKVGRQNVRVINVDASIRVGEQTKLIGQASQIRDSGSTNFKQVHIQCAPLCRSAELESCVRPRLQDEMSDADIGRVGVVSAIGRGNPGADAA